MARSRLRCVAAPCHRAADNRAEAQDLKHKRRRLHLRDLLPEPGNMAACDVARLVRDHADHLIGRFR